jgi:hypothetical protein
VKKMPFVGASKPLSEGGITAAAGALGVSPAEIWTVISVETGGCGFLPDRRPQILFERHYFHRLTGGRFDDGDISDPVAGGYGPSGAHQYDRLNQAIALDRPAALASTSWGLGQIMGENFAAAGFPDVETMVSAMVESEDAQVDGLGSFIRMQSSMANALKTHDWATFALHYNGPQNARNQYDVKLSETFQRLQSDGIPDLIVRAAQLYMTFKGLNPGPVDGQMGPKLRLALQAFQAVTVDAELIARLEQGLSSA